MVVNSCKDERKRDVERQDVSESFEWKQYIDWLLRFVVKHSVGVESFRVFFELEELEERGDTSPRFPYLVTGVLRAVSWIIAPLVLEIYLENDANMPLSHGYGSLFLLSGLGTLFAFIASIVPILYADFTCKVLSSDEAESSLGTELFLFVTIAGIWWSVTAALVSLFDAEWLALMSLFIVFFALRIVSSGMLSMCNCNSGPFLHLLHAIKWLVDGAVGVLGGFIFYLIMSSSGFIVEKREIPTLRNACLILGGLHNPILMPLLPMLAPNMYTYT